MKRILIIGGSSGIGEAILNHQREEHECVNLSRSEPDNTDGIEHHEVDILKDDLPEFDSLDGLVYCPGSINLKPINSLHTSDLRDDFEINAVGAFRVIKHYIPALKKSDNGSIVLFGTVAATVGMSFHTSIASAKGAVESMSRSLAAELAPKIRVNCIAPSLTDTPMAEKLLRNEKQRKNGEERHPLSRVGTPEDFAKAVNYLLHQASWVTGQTIRLDGGLSTIH